jgi:hypothetical protein
MDRCSCRAETAAGLLATGGPRWLVWQLVRIKARSRLRKERQRLDPAGGEWGFFGWHTVR